MNKGDLYFDIGAHLGEKSKPFIEKKIRTIMVEPLPICVKTLKRLYSKNSIVKIIPKGLGSKNTKKILSINKQMPTVSTFAKHWKSGRFSNLTWSEKTQIQITTLDALIKKFGDPQYIKIDVEGYELNVLKGLSKKSGIISFEITSEFFSDAIKCLKHLKKLSYNSFTFSIGEQKKFFSDWSDYKTIINLIKKEIKKDKFFWADIYCK
ncbi:FkbM family methyltransferase [Candidatus Pelagibacter communis]|uniref:FkbM family methyltransferase n=1 Tax=Pelagibacter ubique TaxID=198252 RepID=UPI000A69371F|nr:FkbM family methyltransferase [Candidatus Pelagibacter ubique]